MKMTKNEMRIAAALLRLAADQYVNHGCNDLEPEVVAIMNEMTPAEKVNLLRSCDDWNGGPLEFDSPDRMEDWILMRTLAYILTQTANENP